MGKCIGWFLFYEGGRFKGWSGLFGLINLDCKGPFSCLDGILKGFLNPTRLDGGYIR